MNANRRACILAMTTLLCLPGLAAAQNPSNPSSPPAASSLKTIGAQSFAAAEVAPSLIVINARGAAVGAAAVGAAAAGAYAAPACGYYPYPPC